MPDSKASAPLPKEFWVFDFTACEPYELGGLFLTLLAFPEMVDEPEFTHIHQSICSRAIKERAQTFPAFARAYARLKPIHFAISDAEERKNLRTLRRRLRDRMLAGRLLNVKLALLSQPDLLIPDRSGSERRFENPSINSLIELTLLDLAEENSSDADENLGNAQTRVWRGSSPVVHLAAAAQAYIANLDPASRPRAFGDLIFQPSVLKWVIKLAIDNRNIVRRDAKMLDLEVVASKLIPIRLSE